MARTPELLVKSRNALGEGPVWMAGENCLYWLDIVEKEVHRYSMADASHQVFSPGVSLTALAPRLEGGWICANSDGFCFWDPSTGCTRPLPVEDVSGNPQLRFNDGAVDPQGRFWAGTMNQEFPTRTDGALYRLDPDLSIHAVAHGFTISNGLDWSSDGRTLYFTDSLTRRILAYPFDGETGTLGQPEVLIRLPEEDGLPDGLVVDEEDCLWSAYWGASCVRRFTPRGRQIEELRLPATQVTSCAFGGDRLDLLLITTARAGLPDAELRSQPRAGDLFIAEVGTRGRAQPLFRG